MKLRKYFETYAEASKFMDRMKDRVIDYGVVNSFGDKIFWVDYEYKTVS